MFICSFLGIRIWFPEGSGGSGPRGQGLFPKLSFLRGSPFGIELCAPHEAFIPDVIILMGLHMGEDMGEG